ncbi:MAG: hypothetical protein ACLVJ4_06955 [Mediterraneibacter sp.]
MFATLRNLATDTNAIVYLMTAVGILGVLAKIINQLTLHRLVKAAGNMPKSTHRLIKLVRAKYEHACMIHDSVENIDAFVEKYIYEYRGFLFRIHTWRQIELLSVWFAGILAALGAALNYLSSGFSESVYQYIAGGLAEMVLLSVIIRLSDEPYKVNAVKMYMVDYLDNICAFRLRRQRTSERESIDVIAAESSAKSAFQTEVQESEQEDAPAVSKAASGKSRSRGILRSSSKAEAQEARGREVRAQESGGQEARGKVSRAVESGDPEEVKYAETDKESRLSINIEGEPRTAEKGEAARQAVRRAVNERNEEEDRPVLREETIRQILEEFLA